MSRKINTNLSPDQINRMGQVAIFFAQNTYELTKTKLLKLVYLAEELFVKKHACPFLGVPFNAWQFGPVQKELWVNLDPTLINADSDSSGLLSKYLTVTREPNNRYFIKSDLDFCDDEFSDDEIATLTHIAEEYKYHDAKHLVFITHKGTSLWYKSVIRVPGLMEQFERKEASVSDIVLDFGELFEDSEIQNFYYSQLDLLEYTKSLKYA